MVRDADKRAGNVQNLLLLSSVACVGFLRIPAFIPEMDDVVSSALAREWHAGCFIVAVFALLVTLCDDQHVAIRQLGCVVRLDGWRRWHIFVVQQYTLLTLFFGVNILIDSGARSLRLRRLSVVLFAVVYPAGLVAAAAIRFVHIPAYLEAKVQRWSSLGMGGRPRPLFLYSSGVLMMTGEVIISSPTVPWGNLPALLLFVAWYLSCHLSLAKRRRVCAYRFLDHRNPHAVSRHAMTLSFAALSFALGPLVTTIRRRAPLGVLGTNLWIIGTTWWVIPIREPKKIISSKVYCRNGHADKMD